MSIKIKLLFPLLLSVLMIYSYIEFIWQPEVLKQDLTNYKEYIHEKMTMSETGLIENLLEHDFASLFKQLDSMKKLGKNEWYNLKMVDDQGKTVYPLFEDKQVLPTDDQQFFHYTHLLQIDGTPIGSVELDVDWSVQRKIQHQQIDNIRNMILVFILLALGMNLLFQYQLIYSRISRLISGMDENRAKQDYQLIEEQRSDEIGLLFTAYNKLVSEVSFFKRGLDGHAIVSISDSKGIIRYVNKAFVDVSGYEEDELLGRNHSMLKSGSHSKAFYTTIWKTILEGNIWQGVMCNATKTGQLVWLKTTIVPDLNKQGRAERFIAIRTDITDSKLTEQELLQSKEEAEVAMRTKSFFLANMSHEIRTPINAIKGFTELALDDQSLNSETRDFLRIVLSSSASLLNIINDILDLSKLESGKYKLEKVCFNFPNLIKDTIQLIDQQAKDKSLKLTIEYPDNLPKRMMGDPARLRQILLNLIGNAIKFTEEGGITVSATAIENGQWIQVSVADTGIGMTEEQAGQIFEAFAQADDSTTRRFGGTGLGTTISKQLVVQMAGKIGVESHLGKGSTFFFEIPINKAPVHGNCLYEKVLDAAPTARSTRHFNILLAEDVDINAQLVSLRLEDEGHTVYWVTDGKQVLEALDSSDYDLILMDVMMPNLDGIEATKIIREKESNQYGNPHIPIVALTASGLEHERQNCLDAGMDKLVLKPIDFDLLYQVMEDVVPKAGETIVPTKKTSFEPLHLDQIGIHPDVLNIQDGLNRWGSEEVFLTNLEGFSESAQRSLVDIKLLIENDSVDYSQLVQKLHRIKGVSGNLSLMLLSRSIQRLETIVSNQSVQDLGHALSDLEQDMLRSLEAINTLLASTSEPASAIDFFPDESIDIDALKIELVQAINTLNPDFIEPVLDKLNRVFPEGTTEPIVKAVHQFDFKLAIASANKIFSKK